MSIIEVGEFEEKTAVIRKWVNRETVSIDRLISQLQYWADWWRTQQ